MRAVVPPDVAASEPLLDRGGQCGVQGDGARCRVYSSDDAVGDQIEGCPSAGLGRSRATWNGFHADGTNPVRISDAVKKSGNKWFQIYHRTIY